MGKKKFKMLVEFDTIERKILLKINAKLKCWFNDVLHHFNLSKFDELILFFFWTGKYAFHNECNLSSGEFRFTGLPILVFLCFILFTFILFY